jgi:nucleoside-diphosphate-sugar epimerase
MVIGNGQLAKIFDNFKNNNDTVIFASGVSNSNSTSVQEFKREESLLIDSLIKYKGKKFVYFSSCALSAENYLKNDYYLHKEKMEKIIKVNSDDYYIFRLPQVFGELKNHNTLINFLYFSIINSEPFNLYSNAYRYVIEINDVKLFVESFLKNHKSQIIIDLANPYRYNVLEIVTLIEELVNKKGVYKIIDKYDGYELNLENINNYVLKEKLNINFSENYLSRKLSIYKNKHL